jgi:DNA repair protein RadD
VATRRERQATGKEAVVIQGRPYQLDAIDRVRRTLQRGARRILLVAPTGAGKTAVAALILLAAVERGSRALVVAHRRELIRQPFAKLVRVGVPVESIGIIMASVREGESERALPLDLDTCTDDELWRRFARKRSDAPIQIASIDTLRRRDAPDVDLVIVDEAHRAQAKSYRDMLARLEDPYVLGMTATPIRLDGRSLGELFDAMVEVSTYAELVQLGFLVEPRVFTVPTSSLPDLARVKICKSGLHKGDYDPSALREACDQTGLVGDIVEHYKTHGGGLQALAFAVSIEHSKRIAEQFCNAGIPALHIDGTTPERERDAAIEAHRRGDVRVLCNVDLFGEGTDLPWCKVVILARPSKSVRVFLQQCGRGSRPWGGLPYTLLDHAGLVLEHGLPQAARSWSLQDTKKRAGTHHTGVKQCPCCYAALPTNVRMCGTPQPVPCGCGSVCRYEFGHVAGESRAMPEMREGTLTQVTSLEAEAWAARKEVDKLARRLDYLMGAVHFGAAHAWLMRATHKRTKDRTLEEHRMCILMLKKRIDEVQHVSSRSDQRDAR